MCEMYYFLLQMKMGHFHEICGVCIFCVLTNQRDFNLVDDDQQDLPSKIVIRAGERRHNGDVQRTVSVNSSKNNE